MKRILLLIAGYYLVIQAIIGALNACGRPEYFAYIAPLAALSGWGGYKLIGKARAMRNAVENQPTKELDSKPVDK